MIVGLLGLQGAFQDHIPHLARCGAELRVVRSVQDLEGVDRLIIPGGESTVMSKFLQEFGMMAPLRSMIGSGMPVWGVCAGAILLAEEVDGKAGALRVLPVHVRRNAYGRQIDSSQRPIAVPLFDIEVYMAVFIRAPRIEKIGRGVDVHAYCASDAVFVQDRKIIATTFHPELNRDDDTFHRYFLSI